MRDRYLGIDIGAETIKVVELVRDDGKLAWARRTIADHHKNPAPVLRGILREWEWEGIRGAAVTGRLSRQVTLPRVPAKQAQTVAYRFLRGDGPATIVSIGSHGFSVLELFASGLERFRENSRCSQGTGNFLRQLVERFGMTVEDASRLCEDVLDPAPLSGRCPVILKTDMTHLANKGESRARILAGLFDAVCENVQVLIKPRVSPPRVALIGGVVRSRRIRENFRAFLERNGMTLEPTIDGEGLYWEALGAALSASEHDASVPALDGLMAEAPEVGLETVPALASCLGKVRRMKRRPTDVATAASGPLILGLDIGSTGSKAVALDASTRAVAWEGYVNTDGDPVGAAQKLVRAFAESGVAPSRVVSLGATGSGREIVGSLAATCYGGEAVYVLNEIAAHAEGALHYDSRVDTIFEIGGQDAKYIRLAGGRVVDAAMNEACSAGTGSFIEEQGRKFAGVGDVAQLGKRALEADHGVSLGQHCSVFMAEIIDEAVAAGADSRAIIAGLYDSVIQNYLNRVKGCRSVGQVIFCQGMPFSADALAAAVARQTGAEVVIPPSPGTVGALGIALLALKAIPVEGREPLDLSRFLGAGVETKDTFVCGATRGCGGSGNKCRIDRITTQVSGERKRFTWGGACSLHDSGTGRRKLPDKAPDPFREREELVEAILAEVTERRGGPRVAVTDEFVLKGLFPFFATYLSRLGLDVVVQRGSDPIALKRGIEEANVPFCAPMQLHHGLVSAMAAEKPDFLFLPMLRSLPRSKDEKHAVTCPIAQGSPDVLRWDLGPRAPRVISPVVDIGLKGLASEELVEGCRALAAGLGVTGPDWRGAYEAAVRTQTDFDARCGEAGRRALEFCAERGVIPVVVLGRAYTIHNTVLNSNVPAILREQGAIPIPVDCFPVTGAVPVFQDTYWAYGQRILRAAHQIRRSPGVYSLFCSNYSCGPDSFNIHFYGYIMEGKPFAVIETDGHSGDAGTKTRVEAFLHCVREDLRGAAGERPARSFKAIEESKRSLADIRRRGDTVLVPQLSASSEAIGACLRGLGVEVDMLGAPDRETLRAGRRYTSGKECLPMCLTLGEVLQRLERERDPGARFALLMPTACGPCRFGVYNLLHKVTLQRLGLDGRVGVWSPSDSSYFDGSPPGFSAVTFAGVVTQDMLTAALHDVRPVETRQGAARTIFDRYKRELLGLLEREAAKDLSRSSTLLKLATGRLFGCVDLLRRAAPEFAAVKGDEEMPNVMVVGEIYVRLDPFANGFVIDELEKRGLRAHLAPPNEWLEYTDHMALQTGQQSGFGARLSHFIERHIQNAGHETVGRTLGWRPRISVVDSLRAAEGYLRSALEGEAVLTIGGAVHAWRDGHVDGVVSVGPLECMPNKIAEAQLFHAAEQEGLASVTLGFNGDPLDPEILDNFAFEVHARFRKRRRSTSKVRARGVPAAAPGGIPAEGESIPIEDAAKA